MKYLLNTCVITDFVKNHESTVKKIKKLTPDRLCISVITTSEIEYGIQKVNGTKRVDNIIEITNALLGIIEEVNIDHATAIEAGMIRAQLAANDKIMSAYDILIAATAKVHNLVMVTSNTAEFSPVEDLKLENWREVK
jgi:tRNA(fMet)-specific endonuclease VapC